MPKIGRQVSVSPDKFQPLTRSTLNPVALNDGPFALLDPSALLRHLSYPSRNATIYLQVALALFLRNCFPTYFQHVRYACPNGH